MARTNLVRRFRLDKGFTQQQLATQAGTSQQQIHRIESTEQSVKLDLAFRICKALDADVSMVFPRINQALKKVAADKTEFSALAEDPEAIREMDKAGIDVDSYQWHLKLRVRGRADDFVLPISGADRLRLHSNLQRESYESYKFFVFSSEDREVAVNLKHLVFVHELFGGPRDKTTPPPELDQIRVYLSESTEPLTFEADPDEGDDPDEPDQFHGLMGDLELGVDVDDFIHFVDVDGETAWIKASEIALLELPAWLLDSELLDKEEEESTDGDGEQTGSTIDIEGEEA